MRTTPQLFAVRPRRRARHRAGYALALLALAFPTVVLPAALWLLGAGLAVLGWAGAHPVPACSLAAAVLLASTLPAARRTLRRLGTGSGPAGVYLRRVR